MKVNRQIIQSIVGFLCILLLLAPITVQAQTKVVVIPLYGDDPKPLKNIITVAKANGDFKNPVAAVNSITDASAENPYLVVIGPGVYTITETLELKRYVDIVGSGENITKITGAVSTGSDYSSAIIRGKASINSTLGSLTVENTGGSSCSVAIWTDHASLKLSDLMATASGGTSENYGIYSAFSSTTMRNVTATASGGANNYGVYITADPSPTMTNVTAAASEGINSYGVYIKHSSPTMTNVTATASGGTHNLGVYNSDSSSPTMTNVTARASGENQNHGVYNEHSSPRMTTVTATASGGGYNVGVDNHSSSSPTMTNVTATASGRAHNVGVYNSDSSSPTMTNVTATASGGTDNRGVYNHSGSPAIRRSTIQGSPNSLYLTGTGTVKVNQSTLIGTVHGTPTCVACDDGSGAALDENCK